MKRHVVLKYSKTSGNDSRTSTTDNTCCTRMTTTHIMVYNVILSNPPDHNITDNRRTEGRKEGRVVVSRVVIWETYIYTPQHMDGRVSSYGKRTYTHHSTWMDGRERQTLSITKTTHRHRVYQHSTDTGSSKRQQNNKTTRHHRDTEAKKSLRLRLHVKTTRRTYHQRSSMARRHPSIRILLLLNVSLQERPTLTSCIE